MAESEVDIPQVGPVNKRVAAGVVVAVGGFVGFRYWQAKKTAAAAATDPAMTDPTNPDFNNTNSDPSAVLGAVSPTNSYGSSDTGASTAPTADQSSYGFNGTTNDQWTQYAASQLAQTDQWSYADVVTALGLYLEQLPTTALQQQIVASAIAVAGYPPIGHHVLITALPGTETTPTPAPTATTSVAVPDKPTVSAITKNSATITWTAVPGAVGYIVNTDAKTYKVTGTTKTVSDYKTAGKRYNVQIQAVAANGSVSAKSVNTSFTTKK